MQGRERSESAFAGRAEREASPALLPERAFR
jgi:hypothetical protein